MLRRNTDEMINICASIAKLCEGSSVGFFGQPSRAEINRKVNFLKIISSLHFSTPEEAFVKIYDFYYTHQNKTDRFIVNLEEALMSFVSVAPAEFEGSATRYASDDATSKEKLHQIAEQIKEDLGFTNDESDILLTTIR
ncbi:MAG: hypothetical protein KIT56_01295 [Gammaproteobacteria bacterium]|nr:hypothetical protein [Gammaproteobacteria bacterium]MCW5582520.1 hypothetical protein [Gammaproteobacteria bacterium]